ncbi:MAG: M20 family metallopeptidase [Candidatus Handelsmanbacteria bacterium]|nr:M20 family metallopeptidase [Candidatus Handelsmanbacteria bacterium]
MKPQVLQVARRLIEFPSVSATSNVSISEYIASLLERGGFAIERIKYRDAAGVEKLCIAAKLGKGRGGLSLTGHSDVVPAPPEGWTASPFKARVQGGKLYGRGACDMKGPVAAALCAALRFRPGQLRAPLYFICTADEEVRARGAREVVRNSRLFREAAGGYGLICEPTRLRVIHAHKGSLHLEIRSRGRAAHTSTLKGVNANIAMIPFLAEMKKIYELVLRSPRYRNEEFQPPQSEWSIGINDHNIATNVTPVQSVCTIRYRPMPGVDTEGLIRRTRELAQRHGLAFKVHWVGAHLYTPPDSPLVRLALELTGTRSSRSVPYGTDGAAYAKRMKHLVVLGPGDIAQAHTVDEWVEIDQLHWAEELYARFIERVCTRLP